MPPPGRGHARPSAAGPRSPGQPPRQLRPGEPALGAPLPPVDVRLVLIDRIPTPRTDRRACPRQGRPDGPLGRLEPWAPAPAGGTAFERREALGRPHLARRDLLLRCPRHDGAARGAVALRSPVRPNPIGTRLVRLLRLEGPDLLVRRLDGLDRTPLLDLEPDRCPLALPPPIGPATTRWARGREAGAAWNWGALAGGIALPCGAFRRYRFERDEPGDGG